MRPGVIMRALRVACAIDENGCGTAASCNPDTCQRSFSRVIRIAAPMLRAVVDQRAEHALASARQHFLKRDAVFFNVLVYSGCSAFRFPSARSD
jgi:hypothetical protein